MPVESPCVRNCCLDRQDVCIGCGRTVEEIICWGDADDKEKRQILAVAEKRKEKNEVVISYVAAACDARNAVVRACVRTDTSAAK